jgi:hypothetical protein
MRASSTVCGVPEWGPSKIPLIRMLDEPPPPSTDRVLVDRTLGRDLPILCAL